MSSPGVKDGLIRGLFITWRELLDFDTYQVSIYHLAVWKGNTCRTKSEVYRKCQGDFYKHFVCSAYDQCPALVYKKGQGQSTFAEIWEAF